MKAFRILTRSISDGFKSVFRNFSLSLASILCTTITLILVSVALVISVNIENFTKEIEEDLSIVVFVENSATPDDIEQIRSQLLSIDNINSEEIFYQSKDEVKTEMQSESEVFDAVMSQWEGDDNPLKDTFQIKVIDIEQIGETAEEISKIDHISSVNYGEGMVEKMVNAFKWIERIAYGAVLALVIVTVFLIINTIKLTIFSRQREIGIMRLVGASNFVIKNPFIVEGMVIGLIGSIIPVCCVIFGYTALYDYSSGHIFTPLIKLISPMPFIYFVALVVVIIGIIVGMIGSASATRKYLKV